MTVRSGVLTHWGEHDAVLEIERADFEGGEEFGWIGGEGCARGRKLEWSVKRDAWGRGVAKTWAWGTGTTWNTMLGMGCWC